MAYLLEHWKPVVGFEGLYEISCVGTVRRPLDMASKRAGRVKKPEPASAGYPYVHLFRGSGKARTCVGVHRLVAAAFIGPCPEGMEVNHKDADKKNPRASNLEYLTHQQNIHHAILLGRHGSVSTIPPANKRKLADEQVDRLLELAITMGNTRLARVFGLSESTVRRIRKNPVSYRLVELAS